MRSRARLQVELLLGTLCRLAGGGALPAGSSVVACADVLLLVPPAMRLGFVGNGSVTGLAIAADIKCVGDKPFALGAPVAYE